MQFKFSSKGFLNMFNMLQHASALQNKRDTSDLTLMMNMLRGYVYGVVQKNFPSLHLGIQNQKREEEELHALMTDYTNHFHLPD